jgi:hypothetical protein
MKQIHKKILWIGLAVLASILFWRCWQRKPREGFHVATIPKVIWTYWNNAELPPVIRLCLDSWRKANPDYEVRVVTRESLRHFLPTLDLDSLSWNDSPARESDIVRLNLLAEYGGYWADASILMTEPIPFVGQPATEFAGYCLDAWTSDPEHPVIESWLFGTVAGGKFIRGWRDAFMNLSTCESVGACVERARLEGVDVQKITPDLWDYLYIHIAAQYALQKVMTVNEIKTGMVFLKAEEGPYKYLEDAGWNVAQAVEGLCKGSGRTPIVKFRSHERKILEEQLDTYKACIFGV